MSPDATKAPSPEERIKALTADLAAANKEIESLAYAVSHDLRAPLRAIEGFTDVILEDYKDKLDSEGGRYLGIIKNSSLKASRMIDGILSYSRLGRHEMTLSDVNLDELVKNLIADMRNVLEGRVINFEIAPLPVVRGDFFLLREVWKALLNNAVKFTRHQSPAKIHITSRNENGYYVFSIKDNGIGFDIRYADKLFQLFQKLHSDTEFEGTGASLAIAKRLIARHGGKIWAESVPNEGSVFFFALPA